MGSESNAFPDLEERQRKIASKLLQQHKEVVQFLANPSVLEKSKLQSKGKRTRETEEGEEEMEINQEEEEEQQFESDSKHTAAGDQVQKWKKEAEEERGGNSVRKAKKLRVSEHSKAATREEESDDAPEEMPVAEYRIRLLSLSFSECKCISAHF
jgi:hypothetical protein